MTNPEDSCWFGWSVQLIVQVLGVQPGQCVHMVLPRVVVLSGVWCGDVWDWPGVCCRASELDWAALTQGATEATGVAGLVMIHTQQGNS